MSRGVHTVGSRMLSRETDTLLSSFTKEARSSTANVSCNIFTVHSPVPRKSALPEIPWKLRLIKHVMVSVNYQLEKFRIPGGWVSELVSEGFSSLG